MKPTDFEFTGRNKTLQMSKQKKFMNKSQMEELLRQQSEAVLGHFQRSVVNFTGKCGGLNRNGLHKLMKLNVDHQGVALLEQD